MKSFHHYHTYILVYISFDEYRNSKFLNTYSLQLFYILIQKDKLFECVNHANRMNRTTPHRNFVVWFTRFLYHTMRLRFTNFPKPHTRVGLRFWKKNRTTRAANTPRP